MVTSSAESPAVGTAESKRTVGSHMSSLSTAKVEERVFTSHEGSRSEPSPAVRKGAKNLLQEHRLPLVDVTGTVTA